MSHNPSISIIIPVHNEGTRLRRSIGCLLDQTFRSFEILLVNDGSTDESSYICNAFANEDMRVRVIDQAHSGRAHACNTAISLARGNFIYLMNGGDWCDNDLLAKMHQKAVENDLDLLITGFTVDAHYDNTGNYYRKLCNAPDMIYDNRDEFRAHAPDLLNAHLLLAPGNKLYRREYLIDHGLRFKETASSDLPFNLSVIRDIEHVGCFNYHLYHIVRRSAELKDLPYQHDLYNSRKKEHKLLQDLFNYWNINTPEAQEFLALHYAESLLQCIDNIMNRNCTLSLEEKKTMIRDMISTPQAREALKLAKPRTKTMNAALHSLRTGKPGLVMIQGTLISRLCTGNTNLLARLTSIL